MHWTNSNEIRNMLFASQIVTDMISRTGFSVRSHFQLFCLLMDSWEFRMFNSQQFWIRQTTWTLVLCTYTLFKCYFQHFEKLCSIFHQFHATLDADMLFNKSAILKVYQNCKWNSILLHLLWRYSTVTHNHMLTPSWKWPCEFHSVYI